MRSPRVLLSVLAAGALACAGLVSATRVEVPAFATVRARFPSSEGLVLARDGAPLHALRVNARERRADWVTLAAIARPLQRAVLAIEDRRFHDHAGVDWHAVAGAWWQGLRDGHWRGASTLSMQVAALLAPAPAHGRRTLVDKWRQMQGAWALERAWRKSQILEAYLNLASFRGEIVGIGAASRLLLGKSPTGLDDSDALLLTLLLRSPNAPADALTARGCRLLARLPLAGDCQGLKSRIAGLARSAPAARVVPAAPQIAPHVARRLLAKGPPTIIRSTLDGALQRAALRALQRQLALLRQRNARDGAVLVLDNASGDVLAYVGNAGASASATFVDGVQAPRQAGSTLKPFLYHLALERRQLTAASLLDDSPLNLETPRGLYVPQNYARDFRGLVTVRASLAGSLNIPAIRALMVVGPEAFLARLRALGFAYLTEDAEFYGYALALGSTEVTLWELTNAYRQLARGTVDGSRPHLTRDCRDCAHTQMPAAATRDMHAAAFIVADVLSDRGSRSPTFGLESPLATTMWSAVKTGTSKSMRDNWCIGFTRRYTVGVWVGNFDGSPMHDVSGMSGAAPIWSELVHALPATPGAPAPVPGLTQATVTFHDIAEPRRAEWFVTGTVNADVRPGRTPRAPRIAYPGPHSVLALDPDIPDEHQRVFFTMRPFDPQLTWLLDGHPLSSTQRDGSPAHGWTPTAGQHRLALRARDGRIVDHVDFTVRGFSPRLAAP